MKNSSMITEKLPRLIANKTTSYSNILDTFLVRCHSTKNHNMPKPKKQKGDKVPITNENKGAIVSNLKSPIRTDSDKNILIEVYAKPGAKQNAIVDVSAEGLNVQINAPPVEGSANTELVKYIASICGVKASHVSLERGHKSRNKVLKVSGNITRLDIIKKINAEMPVQSKLSEEG